MIELRHLGGDHGGMRLGQVQHTGRKPNLPGLVHEAREKRQGRSDRFRGRRKVLAEPRLGETQTVGQQHRLPVLLERVRKQTVGRVKWHGEHSELHESSSTYRVDGRLPVQRRA